MLRKIGIVGLTVAVALVVFGCSSDTVTPEGSGTADSRIPNGFYGTCIKATTYPPEPYEGVWVEAWSLPGYDEHWGPAISDEDGEYTLDIGDNQPPRWYLLRGAPPDPEYDWEFHRVWHSGTGMVGPIDFKFHAHPTEP